MGPDYPLTGASRRDPAPRTESLCTVLFLNHRGIIFNVCCLFNHARHVYCIEISPVISISVTAEWSLVMLDEEPHVLEERLFRTSTKQVLERKAGALPQRRTASICPFSDNKEKEASVLMMDCTF